MRARWRQTGLFERCVSAGAGVGGVLGAVVGLVVGLAHPATAWFAVFEAGIPSAIVGGLIGGIAGLTVMAGHRVKGRRDRSA